MQRLGITFLQIAVCVAEFKIVAYLFGAIVPSKFATIPIKSRVTSTYHAFMGLVVATLVWAQVLKVNENSLLPPFLIYTSAFAVYDSLNIYNNIEHFDRVFDILLHHGILIGSLCFKLTTDIYFRLYLAELSTLTLNVCWFIMHCRSRKLFTKEPAYVNKLFKICSAATLIFFFLFRVVNLTHLAITEWNSDLSPILFESPHKNLLFQATILVFGGLNYYWFIILSKKAYTEHFKSAKKQE